MEYVVGKWTAHSKSKEGISASMPILLCHSILRVCCKHCIYLCLLYFSLCFFRCTSLQQAIHNGHTIRTCHLACVTGNHILKEAEAEQVAAQAPRACKLRWLLRPLPLLQKSSSFKRHNNASCLHRFFSTVSIACVYICLLSLASQSVCTYSSVNIYIHSMPWMRPCKPHRLTF